MPLQYLPFSALNLVAWDACVLAAEQAVPYAQVAWLRATAGRWDAVVEVEDATGAYLSVLALPVKRRPWGREVYQPAFTQQLGLLTTADSRHRAVADYLALLPGRYARLYTQLNLENAVAAAPSGFTLTWRQTYVLDLSASGEELLQGYAADYRRRLRVNGQQPHPLAVTEEVFPEALIQLFRRHKGGEVASLKPRHYRQLTQLISNLQSLGQVRILTVPSPETGELLAGALFVVQPRRIVYLFAAASPAGKKAGAPLLLLDYMIQDYASSPGLVLDFEGGMIPSIARFFANFGAAPVPYAALTQTSLPWYLLWKR
ncbi:GNAT family N-acetyltransferase [Hymenobacter persicinus]|uniref:GNAT family N-acetyltransferase n=1 Tax=Hymenobacter persicinus TaxID=2025506 RepID=UPI0013EBA9A2|nr:GNAT family N-acetyltransferase [Hymenobacter persicinus]